jgi:hypothetical protein
MLSLPLVKGDVTSVGVPSGEVTEGFGQCCLRNPPSFLWNDTPFIKGGLSLDIEFVC